MTSVLLGVIGPLAVAGLSWLVMTRTFRRDPGRLTSVMMIAFAAKMLFFGAYVALAMTVLAVRPAPFVTSFVVSFVTLYAVEAAGLRQMLKS